MTTRYRLAKRCERLEAVARELRRPLELQQQRHDRFMRALESLSGVFPLERHEDLGALVTGDRWKGSGLASVLNLIERGFWQPVPIQPAVAEVFLAEPDVQPDARCSGCGTVLPYRMGIWENTETGKSWQGPLTYFKRCPCGGGITTIYGRPACSSPYLPERVVPPWTFVDDRVRWRQERERTGNVQS